MQIHCHVRILVITVLAFAVLAGGCAGLRRPAPGIIVLPSASHVSFNKSLDAVDYTLSAKYPAKSELAQLSSLLAKQGWKPLKKTPLTIPSSHVVGWIVPPCPPWQKAVDLHQWSAIWTNSAGDVVQYTLMYSQPPNRPGNLNTLKVSAWFMDAQSAKNFEKAQELAMKKLMKSLPARGPVAAPTQR